jgi:hypothetical protein
MVAVIDCNNDDAFIFEVGGAVFTSSDTTVVTTNGYTATFVGAGEATITADWDAFTVTQHCFLSAEGECVDGSCEFTQRNNPGQTIITARPRIDSLTPARGLIGSSLHVIIHGQGFQLNPTINAGDGISATVNFGNSTNFQIDATFANTAKENCPPAHTAILLRKIKPTRKPRLTR